MLLPKLSAPDMLTNMQRPLVIITGPTGVGKTDLALELGALCRGSVLNADVGQLYRPLTIGTAKPDFTSTEVPHYLFDIVDQPVNFSVTAFRSAVLNQLAGIDVTGQLPLLVGGSFFYIYSLFYPPHDRQVRAYTQEAACKLPENPQKGDTQQLCSRLNDLDPVRAQAIHKNDQYRIQRALEIYYQTGDLPSSHKPKFMPLGRPYVFVHLTRARDELVARIAQRLDLMLAGGWIEEVAALSPEWQEFVVAKGILGYPEIVGYLRGRLSYEDMRAAIYRATIAYAKRQETFARRMLRDEDFVRSGLYVGSFELSGSLTLSDVAVYIRRTLEGEE